MFVERIRSNTTTTASHIPLIQVRFKPRFKPSKKPTIKNNKNTPDIINETVMSPYNTIKTIILCVLFILLFYFIYLLYIKNIECPNDLIFILILFFYEKIIKITFLLKILVNFTYFWAISIKNLSLPLAKTWHFAKNVLKCGFHLI